MSKENETSLNKNSYVPHILPQWENPCRTGQVTDQKSKIIQLTDENAPEYAQTTSRVGWKRRVDYALKNLETTQNTDEDSSFLAGMLENVISSVIVLATGRTLPDENLINAYVYLKKIRNKFGENPPNISGFLKLLKAKASQEVLRKIESIDALQTEELPPNLTITQVPKILQEKLTKQ